MTINESLAANSALIERELEKYLSRTDAQYGVLFDAMRYGTLGGGKRIRPYLVLEFSRMYGGSDEAALPLACAIELIQAYSLIHDDLPCMDDGVLRRGKPACHRQFGEANALLAGDALLTFAFEVAASDRALPAERIAEAVLTLANGAGPEGMVGGQQLDLIGESTPFDFETLLRMNRLKTGRLIKCACMLGCIAAGQDDRAAAGIYADNIGLTFQIIDDLLDDGTEDGKTTFLTFMSREEAYNYAKKLTGEAVSAVDSDRLRSLAAFLLDRKN